MATPSNRELLDKIPISKFLYSDLLEAAFAEALEKAGIAFRYNPPNRLDFYLPDFDIYIEIKRMHSNRIADQMSRAENVIAIQGLKALNFVIAKLKGEPHVK